MKYFTLKIYGKNMQMRFSLLKYHDRTEALELIEFNQKDKYEEEWARLSVNTGVNPPLNTYWIKTWSENEETVNALIKEGYLEKTGPEIECGYAVAVACKLTAKAKPFCKRDS